MPKISSDEVLTQQHVRGFVIYGPPQPGNSAQYYGVRNQYFMVEGVSNPVQGSISPINAPDPYRRKRYIRIARSVEAPDLGTYDLTLLHKHGTVPRALGELQGCPITTLLTTGRCKNPSDLNRGYESYVYILANGEATDRDAGDMFVFDSDDQLATKLSVTTATQYAVGPMVLGAQASTLVNAEVVDICFAPPRDCDGCDAGTNRIYAITKAIGGSPTYQAELIYSADGGITWSQANITGLGATVSPTAVDVAGDTLVVLCNQSACLFYAPLDPDTGAPGTWSTVTAGFVAAKGPNDLHVVSPNEVWIVGDGGYIYRSRDITAGVTVISAGVLTTQNLNRIHGDGETLVAVGQAQQVLYSFDRGTTWTTPQTAVPVSANATAVCVKSDSHWWVGFGNGSLYYTLNSGKSWTQDTEAPVSATQVTDVVFPTEHVGYVAYVASSAAKVSATLDGGDSWVTGAQRLLGTFPTFNRANRIAVPRSLAPQTDANMVAIAGLDGAGTGGVVYTGRADIL